MSAPTGPGSGRRERWQRQRAGPRLLRLATRRRVDAVVLDHRPRLLLEDAEQGAKDRGLKSGVVRRAEGPAEVEGHPEGARWVNLLRVLTHQADAHRRHAFGFDVVAERTDGARAVRSDGHEDRRGDAVLLE